ncbi:outer membrane protein assembly factor BamA [Roseicyclus persicicus]|uniref:Outer membrane protein assembly factor BamA n=1 Tax=Roseicyclus persicicus TaxID=2650661 RepID=A0A7X6K086_9RHOB|nr:outer membrane protein assembly factor BamA [Roseibacterium persicicum]NKX46000.1 outer membrane protein assembly factor BamA [Roseibacterium persicicum]
MHLRSHARLFRSPRLPLFTALFALIVAFALALPAPAQAQTFRFTAFDVQGNTRISDSAILTYAGIAPGAVVSGAQVNDALQRLQNTGLFEAVEVIPRGATLVIAVQEYPTINRIAIEGNQRLDDDVLLPQISSTPRRAYSPSLAEQDAGAIAEAYRVSGRLTATVTPRIIRLPENRVDLVFEVAEGRVVETERISFVGNRAYSDRRLRRVLESTQAGLLRAVIRRDTFIAERIALDRQLLTDFYQDRGYVDFQILSVTPELARDRDAYFVTFNIREGQSFSLGTITTVSEIPGVEAAAYQDVIRIRSGQTYSPRLIDNTITRMENLATQQGLRFVRVEPRITRNDAARTLDVTFVISRGDRVFVERIDIEGNQTTLDRVIRRQFTTVEGDPFDPRAIRQAAERIRATGFFADVAVEGRPGTASDQVIVDVDVEEQPTGSLGFSASFSTDTGPGLAVTFSEDNFLGRGQALDFAFNTAEGSQAFTFAFTEPGFLNRDLALSLSAFYSETTAQNRDFDTLDMGVRAGLAFPVSEYGRLNVYYGIEQNQISGIDPAQSSPIIAADEGERLNSYAGIQYAYDTRNTGLDPTRGIRLQFGAEYAGLGGDAEYIQATFLGIAEQQVLREEVTLRASFEAGALETISGNSRLNDRFFLSSRQMRGFDAYGLGPRDTAAPNADALGGNFYAVARFEAAFPIGLPDEYGISGGVFYDIGSVWGLDNTVGFGGAPVDDSLSWRQTIGFSIFWDTAIGPLRFNFSHPLVFESYDQTREFDLTIEARF